MGRRLAAFVAVTFGGAFELFGAMFGQGVRGNGLLFGLGGPETLTEAAVIGVVVAVATLVLGVLIMFARDARPTAAAIAALSVGGTLAAGSLFGVGAALALLGALLAARLDRTVPLT